MLGGEGKVVEIDESKFGKCKYDRGRRADGCWVFGVGTRAHCCRRGVVEASHQYLPSATVTRVFCNC